MDEKGLMPRRSLRLLGVLAVVMTAMPAESAPISFGFKGGVALTTFREEFGLIKPSTKTGVTGGAFAEYAVQGPVSVQAEVSYVQRGASLGESQRADLGYADASFWKPMHTSGWTVMTGYSF